MENTIPGKKQQKQVVSNLHLLIRAYQQQGLFEEAEQCLRHALKHHHALANDYQQLQQTIRELPQGTKTLRSDTLLLTPLRSYHEKDFFWQYADPNIAELCVLPNFTEDDEEDWQHWLLRCQQNPTTNLFAVNHTYWGFIGSVNLDLLKDVGFFYSWFGIDFQGHGFGPQAVNLLLDWGRRYLGLRCCYTKVYESNLPSKKLMKKSGFKPLPFKMAIVDEAEECEEYEEEYLYYWGDEQTDRRLFLEINQFFIDMGDELRARPL